jgi:hypothetical protein
MYMIPPGAAINNLQHLEASYIYPSIIYRIVYIPLYHLSSIVSYIYPSIIYDGAKHLSSSLSHVSIIYDGAKHLS